jgi:hypothetical protein
MSPPANSWQMTGNPEVIPGQKSRFGKCEKSLPTHGDIIGKAPLSTESQLTTRRSENPCADQLGSD